MAKNKRSIDDFKNAMLTNTKVIGGETGKKANVKTQAKTGNQKKNEPAIANINIDEKVLVRLKEISKEQKIELDALINVGLNHFVEMGPYWFG